MIIIVGGSAVVTLLSVLAIFNYRISVENEGEVLQQRVEQVYASAQNSLSACLDQGQVAAQVADAEFDRLKDVLSAAVSARYVDAQGNSTSAEEAVGGGALFSAVVEAYPDIDSESFERLQDVVVGCRDEFQNDQDRLLSEVAKLEEWRQTGNIWSDGIRQGFPTDELRVIDFATGVELRGEAALELMRRPVLVSDARDAYSDGELDNQDLFSD